jgi:hypothetical protein
MLCRRPGERPEGVAGLPTQVKAEVFQADVDQFARDTYAQMDVSAEVYSSLEEFTDFSENPWAGGGGTSADLVRSGWPHFRAELPYWFNQSGWLQWRRTNHGR